jgi:hypothetical protein
VNVCEYCRMISFSNRHSSFRYENKQRQKPQRSFPFLISAFKHNLTEEWANSGSLHVPNSRQQDEIYCVRQRWEQPAVLRTKGNASLKTIAEISYDMTSFYAIGGANTISYRKIYIFINSPLPFIKFLLLNFQ